MKRIAIAVIVSMLTACGAVVPGPADVTFQDHLRVCLEHGYSETRYASGVWFCKKLVSNSDVVVSFENVLKERK